MGRSVSQHKNAVETVFIQRDLYDADDDSYFSDFEESVCDLLKEKYPSLRDCDRWSGREDHVIAENEHIEISVSEYCGLVAVCLAPLDPDNAFHVAVAGRMAKSFDKVLTKAFKGSALRSDGFMSNGEQVFHRV